MNCQLTFFPETEKRNVNILEIDLARAKKKWKKLNVMQLITS